MARNSAQNRRLDVLRAIVTQYVATANLPAQRLSLLEAPNSSATIRNDMAVLEEAGLIYQPHIVRGPSPDRPRLLRFADRPRPARFRRAPQTAAASEIASESADETRRPARWWSLHQVARAILRLRRRSCHLSLLYVPGRNPHCRDHDRRMGSGPLLAP